MKLKNKAVIVSVVLLICGYLLWTQRSVTIFRAEITFQDDPKNLNGLYANSERGFPDMELYDIAVDHLALTEWGRIHWYLDHKAELKKKYRIPMSSSYIISIMGIGGGFINTEKSDDDDLYCFTPVKDTKENCIEKNLLLEVSFYEGSYVRYSFGDSEYYWITMPDGKLVRIKGA